MSSEASLVSRNVRWSMVAGAAFCWYAMRLRRARGSHRAVPNPTASETTPSSASSTRPAAAAPNAEASASAQGESAGAANIRAEELRNQPAERQFGLRTLLAALQASDRVNAESIDGPFQLNPGEEVPVICFQFKMSHFVCKAYLAHGADEGSQHLKLQTIFEDNRNSLLAEQRYFVANEWNTTKPYTRLKCGSSDRGRSNVFTLEYDLLCPIAMPHSQGLQLLLTSLRMWYTSMVACVMHIVVPRDIPFASHEMIVANTLAVAVRDEDVGLQREACPICLECFQVGEKVRRLPCMHIFHVVGADAESGQGRHCNIDRHLVLDKQCPVCKTPIDIMERLERERASQSGEDSATRVEQVEAMPETSSRNPDARQLALAAEAGDLQASRLPRMPEASTVQDSGFGPAGGMSTAAAAMVEQNSESTAVAAVEAAPAAASLRDSVASDFQALDALRSQARLPEQAAELERVVRSLQSRWLQIQDVVAGMQTMLRYIEDSQSALSAARTTSGDGPAEGDGGVEQTQQQASLQPNESTQEEELPPHTQQHDDQQHRERPPGSEPAQNQDQSQLDQDPGEDRHDQLQVSSREQPQSPPASTSQTDHEADQDTQQEKREHEQLQAPSPQTRPTDAEQLLPPSAHDELASPPAEDRTQEELPPQQPTPQPQSPQTSVEAEPNTPAPPAEAAAVPHGDAATEQFAEASQRWQPFTAVEKVYSAYAWRRRRLAMLQAAAASSAQQQGDETRS